MRKIAIAILVAAAVSLVAGRVFADEATNAVKVNVDGYLAGSYGITLSDPGVNGFSLDGAQLSLSAKDDATQTSGKLQLLQGGLDAVLAANVLSYSTIEQAYATQGLGPLTLKFGKMDGLIGMEKLDPGSNWNYTRSLLFALEPVTAMGAMLSYQPMDGLVGSVAIFNGSESDWVVDNTKDYEAQLAYTLGGLSVTGNWYLKQAYQPSAFLAIPEIEDQDFLNLILKCDVMSGLSVAGEYLYWTNIASGNSITFMGHSVPLSSILVPSGANEIGFSPKVQGYSLYANYAMPFDTTIALSPRFSAVYSPDAMKLPAVKDANGVYQNPYAYFQYTLDLSKKNGALTHTLELNVNSSSDALFFNNNNINLLYSQFSLLFAEDYAF